MVTRFGVLLSILLLVGGTATAAELEVPSKKVNRVVTPGYPGNPVVKRGLHKFHAEQQKKQPSVVR